MEANSLAEEWFGTDPNLRRRC